MARINIEELWWTDPRRSKLIRILGDEDKADGVAVKMWRLAQEFWKKDRGLVPNSIFETLENNQALVGCGLASLGNDGVYVRGSSQYHDWLHEQRENGKKGGIKSAQRPRDAKGRLLKSEATVQAKPKGVQASYSSSSSSSSSLEVVGEAATTTPEIKKPSSSDNFTNSFGPEAQKLKDFFNSQEILKDMKLFVPQIIHRWTTFDLFMIFYDGILGSAKFPKDKPGRKRYLMAALTNEIGNSKKASK